MTWRSSLAALVLLLGIVFSPLRAAAATIPTLIAYDVAVRSTATTAPGMHDAVRLETERARTACDATYDDSNRPTAADVRGVLAYDDAIDVSGQRAVAERLIYDDAAPTAAAEAVSNPIPQTLARVIGGDLTVPTLGRPGTADVFVTAAEDIAGMSPAQIAERLTIPQSSTFTIYTFEAPAEGLASPVLRSDPGFVGGGLTAGGAREFVLPNGPIPAAAVRTVVGP